MSKTTRPTALFDDLDPQRGARAKAIETNGLVTPMMAQYLEIKKQHPNALVFYRMGDFYELFFEDAKKVAAALDIALTKRGKHLGKDIPMCGVPVSAADNYMHRLIRAGEHIAVAEQVEGASAGKTEAGEKPAPRKLMKRRVVRILTQGTLIEDALLEGQEYNYLLALNGQAVAWSDISTGLFRVKAHANEAELLADIARLQPKEIILTENLVLSDALVQAIAGIGRTEVPKRAFASERAKARLRAHFGEAAAISFDGADEREALGAAGALLDYIEITQLDAVGKLQTPIKESRGEVMVIDPSTRSNLELIKPLRFDGSKKSTLLFVLNETQTSAGARLLAERLQAPLTAKEKINHRLDEIEFFVQQAGLTESLRERLKQVPDMARALTRLSFQRCLPRDLGALRDGLRQANLLAVEIKKSGDALPANLKDILEKLSSPVGGLAENLTQALADSLPATFREGGVVRASFDARLDQQRNNVKESRRKMSSLQQNYVAQTKIKGLKIKYNNVLGFFLEVSAAQGKILLDAPLNQSFIHRQTLANNLRFTTQDLADLASKELQHQAAQLEREKEIIAALSAQVLENYTAIQEMAGALAALDVATTMGFLSLLYNLTRPTIDDSQAFAIEGGRHLVVERALAAAQKPFIPNDCPLDEKQKNIWLLTGPNMAGKSTFLRQNAIMVVMAQAGLFVPAKRAHIGLIDKLFSRIGAADNLAFGQSTFMVEMVETATILTQATKKSFVIVDEIGRGTATFDGLALAWAICEFMCEQLKCRALFATHFHELTKLEEKLPVLVNYHMKTASGSKAGGAHLLYEVGKGAATHSYGIQIASLAGLPHSVIERAGELLAAFESEQEGVNQKVLGANVGAGATKTKLPSAVNKIVEALKEINPETLTPRDALELIFQLQEKANNE